MKLASLRQRAFILIVIFSIAAILRLNHITQPLIDAFSWRQASTAMMADSFYEGNWNIFYPAVYWNGPDLSYQGREFQTVTYTTALLYNILGQHDWVGRSVSVLFGLWGMFALYQLIVRVWRVEHAIFSVAVMALLPGSIFIDRSVLPDPAMVALVVTSCWFAVAYFQTDRFYYLVLACAIGALGVLTKIPGLLVGIPVLYAMISILGRRHRLDLRKVVTLGIAALLILALVVAYYLWARHVSYTYPPYHFAGEGNWLWDDGFRNWWGQQYFIADLKHHVSGWLWTPPIIMLVILGLLFPPPRWHSAQQSTTGEAQKAPLFFHWWLFVGAIYYLIGAKELTNHPWNLHVFNPAAAALAGNALFVIISRAKQRIRSFGAMATALLLLLSIMWLGQNRLSYMYYPYAQRSYELGLALRQSTQPSDLVVTIAEAVGDPVVIFYSQRHGWTFPPAWRGRSWGQLPEYENEAIQLFEDLRANGADWFGVVKERRDEIWQDYPEFASHIELTSTLAQESEGWAIYRILTPEEISQLSPATNLQP